MSSNSFAFRALCPSSFPLNTPVSSTSSSGIWSIRALARIFHSFISPAVFCAARTASAPTLRSPCSMCGASALWFVAVICVSSVHCSSSSDVVWKKWKYGLLRTLLIHQPTR